MSLIRFPLFGIYFNVEVEKLQGCLVLDALEFLSNEHPKRKHKLESRTTVQDLGLGVKFKLASDDYIYIYIHIYIYIYILVYLSIDLSIYLFNQFSNDPCLHKPRTHLSVEDECTCPQDILQVQSADHHTF